MLIEFKPLFDVGKMPDRCVNLAVPFYLEYAIYLPGVEMQKDETPQILRES